MSLVVLSVLSALSHFWYLLAIVCLGAAVWGTAKLSARFFHHLRSMLWLEPGVAAEADRVRVIADAE
jgi:hypothetical protein